MLDGATGSKICSGWHDWGLGMQMYDVIRSSRISWEQATLRNKVMPLLMEWDATYPHTQVSTA